MESPSRLEAGGAGETRRLSWPNRSHIRNYELIGGPLISWSMVTSNARATLNA